MVHDMKELILTSIGRPIWGLAYELTASSKGNWKTFAKITRNLKFG